MMPRYKVYPPKETEPVGTPSVIAVSNTDNKFGSDKFICCTTDAKLAEKIAMFCNHYSLFLKSKILSQ